MTMYIKWLVDEHGTHVPEDEAIKAFSEDKSNAIAVADRHSWKFIPIAGLPTIEDAVDLLMAQEKYRKSITE